MRARHFVVYEGDDLMAFSSEEEQLRKFRNDEIAQHYFEVLRRSTEDSAQVRFR